MELKKALRIATKAHEGQKTKNGHDYITHPVIVASMCETDKAKVVALLHDVVEDTNVTLDDLREQGLGEDIIHAVDCMTKRKDEEIPEYYNRVASCPIATEVKFADMKHNMDITRLPDDYPTEKKREIFNRYSQRTELLKQLTQKEK